MLCSRCWLSLLGLILLGSLPALGWKPLRPPEDPDFPVGHSLTSRAGYIFSGTVKTVERLAPRTKDSVAVMRITFHVDQGIRGARTGETLVIREWAGLWQAGDRYRPGERVMLFLYPPSRLGLTSPVGGASGRFPVDPGGRVVVEPRRVGSTRAKFPGNFLIPPGKFFRDMRAAEKE